MGLLSYMFASDNTRSLKKLNKIVDVIDSLAEKYASMSDAELQGQTAIFKERLANGETLDKILPEAFAVVREASTRVLGLRHFRVQLIGGIVLHQGRIAEMRTGEGKTLTATTAIYLNALTGNNVHLVTVNEYLATSQAEKMGKLYNFLGLTIGCTLAGQTAEGARDKRLDEPRQHDSRPSVEDGPDQRRPDETGEAVRRAILYGCWRLRRLSV